MGRARPKRGYRQVTKKAGKRKKKRTKIRNSFGGRKIG